MKTTVKDIEMTTQIVYFLFGARPSKYPPNPTKGTIAYRSGKYQFTANNRTISGINPRMDPIKVKTIEKGILAILTLSLSSSFKNLVFMFVRTRCVDIYNCISP